MVKVRFGDGMMQFQMDGHAGGERINGIDEVCAAASILAYTMAQTAHGCVARQEAESCEAVLDPGHAVVRIVPEEGMREVIERKVEVILTGFALLAEYRPECIQLTCA